MDNLPPFDLLKEVSKKFPGVWGVLDDMARNPEWDERCYVPIGLAIEIFPDFHQADWKHRMRRMYYALQFSALSVWRRDKEVFQFSHDLQELLFAQADVDDIDIPDHVLKYLPYRAFYVRFSSPQDENWSFWAHNNYTLSFEAEATSPCEITLEIKRLETTYHVQANYRISPMLNKYELPVGIDKAGNWNKVIEICFLFHQTNFKSPIMIKFSNIKISI